MLAQHSALLAMEAAQGSYFWWITFPICVVAFVLLLWLRANLKRTGTESALQDVAARLDGHFRASGLFGRPSLTGVYEEADVEISFPTQLTRSYMGQAMCLRFRCSQARNTVISSINASPDLLRVGAISPEQLSGGEQSQRVDYVFRTLAASDLVIDNGWAEITIAWPYAPQSLAPEAIFEPIEHVWHLVGAVAAKQTTTAVEMSPFGPGGA